MLLKYSPNQYNIIRFFSILIKHKLLDKVKKIITIFTRKCSDTKLFSRTLSLKGKQAYLGPKITKITDFWPIQTKIFLTSDFYLRGSQFFSKYEDHFHIYCPNIDSFEQIDASQSQKSGQKYANRAENRRIGANCGGIRRKLSRKMQIGQSPAFVYQWTMHGHIIGPLTFCRLGIHHLHFKFQGPFNYW